MVALDALEQVHTERFQLVAADAGGEGSAGRVEIAVEKLVPLRLMRR